KWGKMIEYYLQERKQLKFVILLVDLRHPPTGDDCMMAQWLQYYNIPYVVVATKADKVPKTKRQKHLKQVVAGLELHSDIPVIMFSSEEGTGKDEAWEI